MTTSSSAPGSQVMVVLALLAVQLLFGINYVVSKVVVGAFPPLVWAFIRIVISTGLMAAMALMLRRSHPPLEGAFFKKLVIFALLGCVINQASFLVGLKMTTPTNSAILNTLIPVFTLLIVTIRGQEPFTRNRGVGFVLALAGVLFIRKVEEFSLSNATLVGDLLTILNCLSYSLFLSYGKPFLQKYDSVWSTAWLFAYGSVGLLGLSATSWSGMVWPEMTPTLWAAAIFAVVGATLLPYFLNFWALSKAKSSQVAFYIYLQPVVAAGLSWATMNESPTIRTVLACGMIFLGFFMATRPATGVR